jgi:hypothetical protein
MRGDDTRSRIKFFIFIDLMQRKFLVIRGRGGGDEIASEVNIGKWSEGEISECVMSVKNEQFLLVITRSRVWPLL